VSVDDLVSQLVQLIQDPGDNPRRTAIAAAILFAVFLIVVVVALLFLPEDAEEAETGEFGGEEGSAHRAGGARQGAVLRWIMGGATVLMVLMIVGGGVAADRYSRDTRFCLRCHVSLTASVSWEGSTHADVACIRCHETPGFGGGLATRLRGVQNAAAALSRDAPPTAVVLENRACASCHENDLADTLSSNNIRVRHEDFADQVSCKQCHGRVGHQPREVKSGALPGGVMWTCADCHDGRTAANECSTCHERDMAMKAADTGGFAKIDLPGPSTCRGCHDLTGCNACHGIEMPHPADWSDPKMHAPRGAFDRGTCSRCHDRNCTECHIGLHDSHGPDWREEHKEATDGTTCTRRCHDKTKVGVDMCTLCHPNR